MINFTSIVHFSLELRYFACSSKVSSCSNRFNEIFGVVVVIGFYIMSLKTSHVMRMRSSRCADAFPRPSHQRNSFLTYTFTLGAPESIWKLLLPLVLTCAVGASMIAVVSTIPHLLGGDLLSALAESKYKTRSNLKGRKGWGRFDSRSLGQRSHFGHSWEAQG